MSSLRVSAVNFAPSWEGDWILAVVAKRTYQIANSRCQLADEQLALIEAPTAGDVPYLLAHDSDLIVNRRLTDIIVKGFAYPPSSDNQTQFPVRIAIDNWVRDARVFGDRHCEVSGERSLKFSAPRPVEKVPLDWSYAYGGVDAAALTKYGDPAEVVARKIGVPYLPYFGMFGYPRNPLGRGYVVEWSRDDIEGMALPNIEEPTMLVSPQTLVLGDFRWWPRAPVPAAFGWLPYAFFPRSSQAGFPIRPYFADKIGPEMFPEVTLQAATTNQIDAAFLPFNGNLGVVQGSAITMRSSGVNAGAAIELVNMHPQWATWRFVLKTPPPQMYLRFSNAAAMELTPRVHILVIEPEVNRVSVVWVGQTRRETRPNEAQIENTQHVVAWRD